MLLEIPSFLILSKSSCRHAAAWSSVAPHSTLATPKHTPMKVNVSNMVTALGLTSGGERNPDESTNANDQTNPIHHSDPPIHVSLLCARTSWSLPSAATAGLSKTNITITTSAKVTPNVQTGAVKSARNHIPPTTMQTTPASNRRSITCLGVTPAFGMPSFLSVLDTTSLPNLPVPCFVLGNTLFPWQDCFYWGVRHGADSTVILHCRNLPLRMSARGQCCRKSRRLVSDAQQ
jgi:hypothetical protein